MRLSFYPEEAVKEAIEKAKKFGYINDERYAGSAHYVSTYKDKYNQAEFEI